MITIKMMKRNAWRKTVRISAWAFLIAAIAGCSKQPARVYYINSYHEGFPSSDQTMAGIQETFEGQHIDLKIHFMDTKRNPQVESIEKAAQLVLEEIRAFDPDLIIASDDNAVKEVIAPHFSDGSVPVLFCGVNWTCWQYDLPTPYVTADLVFVFTNGAIKNWNDEEAEQFVRTHIRKPVFTVEDPMMPFAVIGFSKVAHEQGLWVATTALDIIAGTPIHTVALTKNQQTRNFLNLALARKINFVPGEELLATCEIVEN